MNPGARLSLAFILGASFLLSSCGYVRALVAQAQDQAQAQDADRLVEISRTYATSALPSAATPPTPSSKTQSAAVPVDDGPEYEYESQIMMYLVRNDYDSLDREARDARSRKVRFKGGPWKLYDFYEGISKPPSGDQATDEDWNLQIEALKAWVAARPESAAARIALAETYLSYGWRARGSGYADTVSDDGWNLFGQRVSMAASALVDAAKLKEKCPYWFEVMQQVALAQGWDKSQAKELLDAAMSFEPGFYHYYREIPTFCCPNGMVIRPMRRPLPSRSRTNSAASRESSCISKSPARSYADAIRMMTALSCNSCRGRKSKMATPLSVSCMATRISKSTVSRIWPSWSTTSRQLSSALAAIGDNWEPKVWHQQLDFLKAKAWAESQQGQSTLASPETQSARMPRREF